MAKVLVSEENLTNIANAIREKNGEIRFCNDYFTVTKMQMM